MTRCEKLNSDLSNRLTEQELIFFDDYLQTPQAIDHAIEVQEQTQSSRKNLSELAPFIQGLVFETIANSYLQSQVSTPNQRLLSTYEVLALYKRLYPKRDTIINQGLAEGIQGISVPDGILLSKKRRFWQIEAIYEMQSGSGFLQDEEQSLFYENAHRALVTDCGLDKPNGSQDLGDLINEICPDFYPFPVELDPKTLKIIDVIPQYSRLKSPYIPIRIPITKKGYTAFINSILLRCSEQKPVVPIKIPDEVLIQLLKSVNSLPSVATEILRH